MYFPIDYTAMNEEEVQMGEAVPRNFFVFDNSGAFEIDKYDGRLVSPSCAHAKYSARRVDNKIYIVRIFIDDPDETSDPCLVTPEPKEG